MLFFSYTFFKDEVAIVALLESGEMYLETILLLSREKKLVRAIDVGERLSYSKPSVSRAMGILRNSGFITVGNDGAIALTESGKWTAEKVFERHVILTEALKSIGIPEEIASADACKIEHVISDETLDAIKAYVNGGKDQ